MLDRSQLQSAFDEAVDDFVERLMRLAPVPPTADPPALTALGKEVLRVVAAHPEGVTANGLTDETGVGLAPMFQELRDLMASNQLLRIVRGEDQLPVYVLPSARPRQP